MEMKPVYFKWLSMLFGLLSCFFVGMNLCGYKVTTGTIATMICVIVATGVFAGIYRKTSKRNHTPRS